MIARYRYLPDWFYYFGVLPLLAALPRSLSAAGVRWQAGQLLHSQPEHCNRMLANLLDTGVCVDEQQARSVVLRCLQQMIVHDLDTFRYPFWSVGSINRHFRVQGLHHLQRPAGQGVLLVSGHFGGFATALIALGILGHSVHTMAHDTPADYHRHQALKAFARFQLHWMQRRSGGRLLLYNLRRPRSQEVARANLEAFRLLKKGEIVLLLLDIFPSLADNVTPVEMLGRTLYLPSAPVQLARLSGARVLPYFVLQDPGSWQRRLVLGEPVTMGGDISRDLQSCIRRLELMIERHPDHWFAWDSLSSFTKEPATAGGT